MTNGQAIEVLQRYIRDAKALWEGINSNPFSVIKGKNDDVLDELHEEQIEAYELAIEALKEVQLHEDDGK